MRSSHKSEKTICTSASDVKIRLYEYCIYDYRLGLMHFWPFCSVKHKSAIIMRVTVLLKYFFFVVFGYYILYFIFRAISK